MPKQSNPAAQLAAMRRKETKPCAVCGESFTGVLRAKYCSNKCRQKAHYKRTKS